MTTRLLKTGQRSFALSCRFKFPEELKTQASSGGGGFTPPSYWGAATHSFARAGHIESTAHPHHPSSTELYTSTRTLKTEWEIFQKQSWIKCPTKAAQHLGGHLKPSKTPVYEKPMQGWCPPHKTKGLGSLCPFSVGAVSKPWSIYSGKGR